MADNEARPEQQEIATTMDGRDITRGFISPIQLLRPEDTVLMRRGGGDLRLYEELKRDDQVISTWASRQGAVVSAEWEVEPGGNGRQDQAAADFLREQLQGMRFDNATKKMLWGIFYGYSVAEMMWGRDGRFVTIDEVKVRNRRRFRFDGAGRLRLLTAAQPHGEFVPDRKFWWFATGADHDDEPYGLGLGHYLYWPLFFKRNGMRLWLVFLDKFGQPTGKGTYPPNSTPNEKQKLLDALQAIHTESGVIVPEGMQIELIEAARSGTADYTSLYDRMDAAISKVILGHTGSADSTPGRLGGEDMADTVRKDLVKADADVICESFNQGPARWLTAWNYPNANPPRVWRRMEEQEDLNEQAKRDETLTRIGYRPTLRKIQDTYGEGYEEAPAPPQGGSPGGLAFSEREDEAPRAFADRLEDETGPALEQMIEPVRRLVQGASSFEEIQRGLEDIFEDLPEEDFARQLQKAFAAAELAGRDEVNEGE